MVLQLKQGRHSPIYVRYGSSVTHCPTWLFTGICLQCKSRSCPFAYYSMSQSVALNFLVEALSRAETGNELIALIDTYLENQG